MDMLYCSCQGKNGQLRNINSYNMLDNTLVLTIRIHKESSHGRSLVYSTSLSLNVLRQTQDDLTPYLIPSRGSVE